MKKKFLFMFSVFKSKTNLLNTNENLARQNVSERMQFDKVETAQSTVESKLINIERFERTKIDLTIQEKTKYKNLYITEIVIYLKKHGLKINFKNVEDDLAESRDVFITSLLVLKSIIEKPENQFLNKIKDVIKSVFQELKIQKKDKIESEVSEVLEKVLKEKSDQNELKIEQVHDIIKNIKKEIYDVKELNEDISKESEKLSKANKEAARFHKESKKSSIEVKGIKFEEGIVGKKINFTITDEKNKQHLLSIYLKDFCKQGLFCTGDQYISKNFLKKLFFPAIKGDFKLNRTNTSLVLYKTSEVFFPLLDENIQKIVNEMKVKYGEEETDVINFEKLKSSILVAIMKQRAKIHKTAFEEVEFELNIFKEMYNVKDNQYDGVIKKVLSCEFCKDIENKKILFDFMGRYLHEVVFNKKNSCKEIVMKLLTMYSKKIAEHVKNAQDKEKSASELIKTLPFLNQIFYAVNTKATIRGRSGYDETSILYSIVDNLNYTRNTKDKKIQEIKDSNVFCKALIKHTKYTK